MSIMLATIGSNVSEAVSRYGFTSAADMFERGGPVMWPLLLCSIVAMAVTIERLLAMARDTLNYRRCATLRETIYTLVTSGNFDEVTGMADQRPCYVSRMLIHGLKHRELDLHDSLEIAANAEIDRMRSGLSILDTIITLAPLLGILGTVTGIISSFHLLQSSGLQDPAAVTGGIAEALITTAAGLLISISTLIPFNYFGSRLRRVARDLEQSAHRLELAHTRGVSHEAGNRI
jgi:biopolymer transport protein ExbB